MKVSFEDVSVEQVKKMIAYLSDFTDGDVAEVGAADVRIVLEGYLDLRQQVEKLIENKDLSL